MHLEESVERDFSEAFVGFELGNAAAFETEV